MCQAKILARLSAKIDELVKSPNSVTPAKAGVQKSLKLLDSGFSPVEDSDSSENDNKVVF